MFLFHERTRKSLCRLGFVALCIVPTCALGLWSAVRNSDAHRTACEAELSELLRLKVTLGNVEYPQPGDVRYHDFLVVDPETEIPVVRAAKIDIHTTDGALAITASQLTIETNAASVLAELLHDRLRQPTRSGEVPLRIAVGQLIAASPGGDIPLADVRLRLEPTSEGRGAQITFRTSAMAKDSEPVVLTLVRSRDAKIGFELLSRGAFREPQDGYMPVVQLLRTLVSDNQVFVPVSREAEELMRIAPIPPPLPRAQ